MENDFDEKVAQEELEQGFAEAEKILGDQDKIEKFLQRLEKKLKGIPVAGSELSKVPVLASLFISFVRKQYTNIPTLSIVAITSALIYFVSPIDIIPDFIPGVGHLDDAAVIIACWKMVSADVEEYVKWREDNGLVMDV